MKMLEDDREDEIVEIFYYLREYLKGKSFRSFMNALNFILAEAMSINIKSEEDLLNEDKIIDKLFSEFKELTISAYKDIYKSKNRNPKNVIYEN